MLKVLSINHGNIPLEPLPLLVSPYRGGRLNALRDFFVRILLKEGVWQRM